MENSQVFLNEDLDIIENNIDVVDYIMLGDFNQDGNYIVDKQIVAELISMLKVITKSVNEFKFCESVKKFSYIGHIQFGVDISVDETGEIATAVLVLIEKMNDVNGYLEKTNAITIAKFVGYYDKDFEKRAYKYLNIVHQDEIAGVAHIENNKEKEFYNIISRVGFMASLKKLVTPYLNRLEKEAFSRKKDILDKSEEGKEVIEYFTRKSKAIDKIYIDDSKSDYYKHLNKLLDNSVEKNSSIVNKNSKLKNSLVHVKKFRNENSELVIANKEKSLVKSNTIKNANEVLSVKNQNKKSKGMSLLPVFREDKNTKKVSQGKEKITQENSKVINKAQAKAINQSKRIDNKAVSQTQKTKVATSNTPQKTSLNKADKDLIARITAENKSLKIKQSQDNIKKAMQKSYDNFILNKKSDKVSSVTKSPSGTTKSSSSSKNVDVKSVKKAPQSRSETSAPTFKMPTFNMPKGQTSKSSKKDNVTYTSNENFIDVDYLDYKLENNENVFFDEQKYEEKVEHEIQDEYEKYIQRRPKSQRKKTNEEIYRELLGNLVENEHATKNTGYSFKNNPAKKPIEKIVTEEENAEEDFFVFTHTKD